MCGSTISQPQCSHGRKSQTYQTEGMASEESAKGPVGGDRVGLPGQSNERDCNPACPVSRAVPNLRTRFDLP